MTQGTAMTDTPPIAVTAIEVPPRARPSTYPADLVARIGGREKRVLGDLFGLQNFGVKLTRLPPDRPPPCAMRMRSRTNSSMSWKATASW